jgi:hypothetical protein
MLEIRGEFCLATFFFKVPGLSKAASIDKRVANRVQSVVEMNGAAGQEPPAGLG